VYDDYNDPGGGSGDPESYAGATYWAKHLNWYRQQRELFVKAWRLNPDHHSYFWPDDFKQLFSTWILKRHNNRPNFEALFPPPDPDHPDSRPADEDDPELPIYIQEYESPTGGGGEATDYPGDTREAKLTSWQRHQEQIFSRRWRLPPNYRTYNTWALEYVKEFKQWMAGRFKNRPKFADDAPAAFSEEDLADYEDPDGGGGRPEDYKGSTYIQKHSAWFKVQMDLFARRWKLRADEYATWPADFRREFGKWLSQRARNKPPFHKDPPSARDFSKRFDDFDETTLSTADLDHRGRSLRTSGYVQIFEEEEELATPMTADELPAPRRPVHRSAKTDDLYEEGARLPGEAGEPFGDELEQRIMADPWEWLEIPNPRPRPPATYPIWTQWPAPTCPPAKPSPASPLPETFSLLCPDGERRDFFGPFGMDSFLAKIRLGRGVAFQNFCIIRNPGQKPGLKFEVVDSGYNKFAYAGADADGPLLLKLAFRFYTLTSDEDLVSYIC